MAWNPSAEVAVARDFGKKFGYDKVYIIAVNEEKGTFQTISYGETKKKCGEARICSDKIYEMIRTGELQVSEQEGGRRKILTFAAERYCAELARHNNVKAITGCIKDYQK